MKRLIESNTYLPIINGFIGDKLAASSDSWAIGFSLRLQSKDLTLAEAIKRLKNKNLVIYVHGLMADEKVWKHFQRIEPHFSCLYLRYNTGLHISENGKLLSEFIAELYEKYAFKKIHLVGHSMGGLVIRSACYQAQKKEMKWVKQLKTVFLIAVPNTGAVLEKLTGLTSVVLRRIARFHIGKLGDVLEQRSNGIKDLRLGAMLEEDWKSGDTSKRSPVHPVIGVDYHILIGNLLKDENSVMAKYFGDGLVTRESAVGATLIRHASVKVFPQTGHNSILNSPSVVEYVLRVLKKN
mgnify:FL=1